MYSIARDLQSLAERDKSGQLARFRELYGQFNVFLHRNHYLLMLLKRHIIVLSSHDIAKCDADQVTEIKKMCEEVSSSRRETLCTVNFLWAKTCSLQLGRTVLGKE